MIETLPEGLGAALETEFRRGWEFEKAQAEARQGKLGKINAKDHRSIDGLGEMIARIDSSSYHYWTHKEGADCWSDKSFMNAYLRDNPQARVKSGGTKIQIGHR